MKSSIRPEKAPVVEWPSDESPFTIARALTGLNQSELANRAGISESVCSRIESGKQFCSPDTAHKLDVAFTAHPVSAILVRLAFAHGNELQSIQSPVPVQRGPLNTEDLYRLGSRVGQLYDAGLLYQAQDLAAWCMQQEQVNLPYDRALLTVPMHLSRILSHLGKYDGSDRLVKSASRRPTEAGDRDLGIHTIHAGFATGARRLGPRAGLGTAKQYAELAESVVEPMVRSEKRSLSKWRILNHELRAQFMAIAHMMELSPSADHLDFLKILHGRLRESAEVVSDDTRWSVANRLIKNRLLAHIEPDRALSEVAGLRALTDKFTEQVALGVTEVLAYERLGEIEMARETCGLWTCIVRLSGSEHLTRSLTSLGAGLQCRKMRSC